MKIRKFIESVVGFSLMGLSIYLSFSLPNKNPSPALIFMFMVGLIGPLAPRIRLSKSYGVKRFLSATATACHCLAGLALVLGVIGTLISGTGIGVLIGLMVAAFIYAIGSGLKSI